MIIGGKPSRAKTMRSAVRTAQMRGVLPAHPSRCEVCGTRRGRMVLHHHSEEPEYWLDVVAVCESCHGKIHAGTIAEPATGLRRPERDRSATPATIETDHVANARAQLARWEAEGVQRPPWVRR